MRNVVVLLGALSLVGCGGGGDSETEQSTLPETTKPMVVKPTEVKPIIKPTIDKPIIVVKPVVKLEPEVAVDPKDTAITFFHVDMYQNGSASIKYVATTADHQLDESTVNVFNQHLEYEDKISHKLKYKDANGNIHTEYYIVDVPNKVITKVDESILYNNNKYKTFHYMDRNVQFDFNLEKNEQTRSQFNTKVFDNALHQIVVIPTKVTTTYLGLEKIEAGGVSYNSGKFKTVEENKSLKAVTTTWFNITNGVIIKQLKNTHNTDNNTVTEEAIDIVDSNIDYNANTDQAELAKFKLDFMNGESTSNNDINLYTGANDPITVNVINNTLRVDGYKNNNTQFMPDSVVDVTLTSYSNGILSSFISKIQYARECEVNCLGADIATRYILGVKQRFNKNNDNLSEYAGKYAWYRAKDSLKPSNYFIVINVNAKTCQISSRVKLNAYECVNLDVDPNNGQITAIVIEKGEGTYGSLFAYINGKNNEYITGVVRSKGDNDDSVDTFIIKSR